MGATLVFLLIGKLGGAIPVPSFVCVGQAESFCGGLHMADVSASGVVAGIVFVNRICQAGVSVAGVHQADVYSAGLHEGDRAC